MAPIDKSIEILLGEHGYIMPMLLDWHMADLGYSADENGYWYNMSRQSVDIMGSALANRFRNYFHAFNNLELDTWECISAPDDYSEELKSQQEYDQYFHELVPIQDYDELM